MNVYDERRSLNSFLSSGGYTQITRVGASQTHCQDFDYQRWGRVDGCNIKNILSFIPWEEYIYTAIFEIIDFKNIYVPNNNMSHFDKIKGQVSEYEIFSGHTVNLIKANGWQHTSFGYNGKEYNYPKLEAIK